MVEATRQVKPANKSDVLRVEHIWAGVAALLAGVKEPLSHGPGFQQFLAATRMCVVQLRRTERLCQLLVSLSSQPHGLSETGRELQPVCLSLA